jgi:drug/metabolite transporter (DMT)-like permease
VVGTYIGIATGVAISALAVFSFGQEQELLFVTLASLILFALVGVFHFALARQLSFVAIKNLGANETSAIISTQIIYSLVFAILILNESMTLAIVAGSALILMGLLVLDVRSGANRRKGSVRVGIVAAMLTGLVYGFTPILIRIGLLAYHFFLDATFLAYVSAMIIFLFTTNANSMFSEIKALPKFALAYYIVAGVFAASAQLLRFWALNVAPVVTVAPILASSPIFTLIMTRTIAHEIEVFEPRILISIFLVVIGTVSVSLGAGISV